MCVSAIAIGMSEQWPLVIAGNRDEFLHRPTLPLQAWTLPSGVSVWSGRDELDGGAWLATTPDGNAVALVTNVRQGTPQRGRLSRGQLTVGWIDAVTQGRESTFLNNIQRPAYGGFNLICGLPHLGQWWYLNNQDMRPAQALAPGLYGLSNASLDTPWPKSERLKQQTRSALNSQAVHDMAFHLAPTFQDRRPATELPDTGVGEAAERVLSSVFIEWPEREYGTRSSHVLAIDRAQRVRFWEATYATAPAPQRHLQSRIYSLA